MKTPQDRAKLATQAWGRGADLQEALTAEIAEAEREALFEATRVCERMASQQVSAIEAIQNKPMLEPGDQKRLDQRSIQLATANVLAEAIRALQSPPAPVTATEATDSVPLDVQVNRLRARLMRLEPCVDALESDVRLATSNGMAARTDFDNRIAVLESVSLQQRSRIEALESKLRKVAGDLA